MARKRMFDIEVVDTDLFLDMPQTTQNLYFHLGMRADDDGFVSKPKKIVKLISANEDDLKILITKKFVIPFDTGVIVIRHWKLNNYLRKDRYIETIYKEEKSMLTEDENGVYELGIPNVNQMSTNGVPSIEENSIEENSIDNKSSIVVAEGEITDKEIEPDINNKKKIPYDEIVKLYHQICLSLPKVIKLTESRKKTIKARYEEYDRDIGVFRKVFQYAEDNDFYKGNNNNNWKADFDWLISPNKMIKILEKANNVEMKEEKTEEKANERKWQ